MNINLSNIGKFRAVVTEINIRLYKADRPGIGYELYCKNIHNGEYWSEYDGRGNLINFKNSCGFEGSQTFDSNDHMIHYKNNQGCEWWKDSAGELRLEIDRSLLIF